MADKPVTREEKYLAYLTGDYKGEIPKPITRKENYLYELCLKGIGGEISPEEIKNAVNEYLEKNPVKPGATTEQAAQIEQNKTDITSLKTDISTKITKFYASNQGETHLADSDNGKIMDMVLYGRSEQKQYSGKNLIPPITYSGNISGLQIDVKEGLVRLKGTPNAEVNYPVFGAWSVTSPTLFTLRAGDYTASGCGDTSNPRVNLVYLNNGRLTSINGNKAFTLDKDANFVAVFVFADANKYVDITFTPMIEKGSTATSYEPYTGGIPSPNPDYPQEIKSVVNPTVKVTNEDGLKVQSITLNNITLNSIPVSSGGNVTIDGQQYIADYVDIERGKLVKKLKSFTISDIEAVSTWGVNANADNITGFYFYMSTNGLPKSNNDVMTSTILRYVDNTWGGKNVGCAISSDSYDNYAILSVPTNMLEDISSDENACASLVKICENTNAIFFYSMTSPIETDLTPEEIEAFKELVTYYPVTNVSVNSEQLDGYTVFNYPISMANGWNYVKKQLNDNRDYIYDMDTQSAEAYVNSEYAVALTELEV